MLADSILNSPWLGNLRASPLGSPWVEVALIGAAVVCGTILGRERRARHKPAGMRTLTLICLGSTIFTMCSMLLPGPAGDPSRIASSVVTGIGFLGAGTILRQRGTITGLTTAATIWVMAAIGVLIGIGYAVPGVLISIVVFVLLKVHESAARRAREAESDQHVP